MKSAHEHRVHIPSRTIFLFYDRGDKNYDIEEANTASAITNLHVLSSMDREADINIIINNKGGDQQHGLGIYDMIRNIPNHVTGTVYGYCNSMAMWILQACDLRRAALNSELMIHDGKRPATQSRFDDNQDERCRQIILDRIREKIPDYSRRNLLAMLKKDTYMTAEEARDLGLLDEIVPTKNSTGIFRRSMK